MGSSQITANPNSITAKDQRKAPPQSKWRVLYGIGPGDIVKMYRELLENTESALQMHKDFSKLFLDWCDDTGAWTNVISWHPRTDVIVDGRYRFENRPKPAWYYAGGIKHHIGEVFYGLGFVWQAIKDRANIVVADSGTAHWIVLALLPIFGIPVIAVMHNSLWAAGFPPKKRLLRILSAMDGIFFRYFAAATINVSPECERQIRQVAGGKPKGLVLQCRAQYRRGFLDHVKPIPPHSERPFRVMFLGRVEAFKGVFMILDMAERLEKEFPGQFTWKIVGGGSAVEPLRKLKKERNLAQVEVTGRLSNDDVMAAIGWSHIMVAPTTSGFFEGLAMTAAEAVLAGRPVVLSTVVPAWEVLDRAAILCQAENVDSFVAAFKKLILEPEYYEECARATVPARGQFYDESQGLGVVLGEAITKIG